MEIEYQTPRKGITVSPTYDPVTGEMGEPEVGIGHAPTSPFADHTELDEDYLNPESLEPSESEGEDLIVEAIHELYPDLDSILDYAIDTYGDEITAMYDQAIEDSDWSSVNKYLETWSEEFRENQSEPVDYEAVTQELNSLAETEAEGTELAYELLQQAEQSSDPLESEILQMSAAFHRGEVSAETAIQSLLDKHDINQLISTYKNLYS